MAVKRLKIAYITVFPTQDINNWSGTVHFIGKTLQEHVGDVTYINIGDRKIIKCIDILNRWWDSVYSKKFYWERTALYWRYHAARAMKRVNKDAYDIIFSPGSIPLGLLNTNIPVYMYSDATFHSMVGYYMHHLSGSTIRSGDALELKSFRKCRMIFLSSEWAVSSAVNDYGIPREKIAVIPFGANVETGHREYPIDKPVGQPVRFLFIGVDPIRKGLSRAIAIVEKINAAGVHAEMDIVGCSNRGSSNNSCLRWHGYLNKNIPAQAAQIEQLYANADFFIMPSIAECSAVVYCEAASYGLPLIGSNTGGTPTIIKDAVNGFLLDNNEDVDQPAERILTIIRDPEKYFEMRKNSKRSSEERLNWDAAGRALSEHINRSMSSPVGN